MAGLKPMLAAQYEEDRLKGRFPLILQPKLDGIRCIVKDGVPLSRTLKPIPNKHVQAEFKKYGLADLGYLDGLDGELMVGDWSAKDVYRKTNSAMMSYDGSPDFQFVVFDHFQTATAGDPYMVRRRRADAQIQEAHARGCEWVTLLYQNTVNDIDELLAREQSYLARGYEGAIIRSPNGKYKFGRSTANELALMKLKRFEDSEAVIIGFEEKMHNGNEAFLDERGYTKRSSHQANLVPQGTLGALICKGNFNDGVAEFNIGTGFDDSLRQSIWDQRDTLLGQSVKYKHFSIGAKDAPRHPVFLGFRDPIDQ